LLLSLTTVGRSPEKHRDAEQRAIPTGLPDLGQRVLGIRENVQDLDGATLEQRATDHRATFRHVDPLADETLEIWREAPERHNAVNACIATRDIAIVRVAELDRSIDHRLEHGVEFEGRTRNRLGHIANCRLALRRALLFQPKRGQLVAKRFRRIMHGSKRRTRRRSLFPLAR
jgi:hypothetical protein